MSILAVLNDGDFKHLARRCTVDIPAAAENIESPLLIGKPCDDSRLYSGVVANDKAAARLGYKRCSNQLGEGAGHTLIQCLDRLVLTRADQSAGCR